MPSLISHLKQPALAKEDVEMERNDRVSRNLQGVSQANALRKIQELDFALYETVLYLDAYPTCKEALAYYRSLLDTREQLVKDYERAYSPLSAFSNKSTSSWDWINGPWPWQYEAN